MPHVVVEGDSEYLGVRFLDGPAPVAGIPARFVLELMYYPSVKYDALTIGKSFQIREGGRVVAVGKVLALVEHGAT